MSKRSSFLDKANHSKEVADYLNLKGGCNDWVITIIFYTALYYANHIIFPYDDTHSNKYHEFEKLYHDKKNVGEGRHGFIKRFIAQEKYPFSAAYAMLHDLSIASRYNKKGMTDEYVTNSYACLNSIIKTIDGVD